MRLIDANELITALDGYQHHITLIKKKSRKTEESILCDVKGIINSIPTIEEQKKGEWIIEEINKYELSYGTTAYEPVYRCSVCGRLTESYLRLDEPIMPEDADFPRFCPWCGVKMDER